MMAKILVTGSAGFIGHHVVMSILSSGYSVVGLDNLNDYYSPKLKVDRLVVQGFDQTEYQYNRIYNSQNENNQFIRLNLEDKDGLDMLFSKHHFSHVVHLGAQAGVRYSLDNPQAYIDSNIIGTFNILEHCRHNPVQHLIVASSSSVYGNSNDIPFQEGSITDSPISLYAATKKSNELLAYSYSHLFQIPTTCLRFFTVYGPWGRPDMAIFIFTKSIIERIPIKLFNNGDLLRDFTYVSDIVNSILQILEAGPKQNSNQTPPYSIYNIGNSKPVKLVDFIRAIENSTGVAAVCENQPMQPGDVYMTYADTTALSEDYNYKPVTEIQEGVDQFVKWYRDYYKV
jgi:UDP-glucuronate 4-epimerase